MDNLNDWLYIVLLVIAVISGLLKSVKKNKQPEEILRQPEPDLDEDQEYWEWETNPVPKPAEIEKKEKTPPPLPKQSAYIPLFKEGERNIHTGVNSLNQPEDVLQEVFPLLPTDVSDHTEEWKKAIIYSEILKRKY
jgi:hypothetical protein